MKCDIVLRGGFLFDPENGVKKETDIGILDGKIAALDGPMSGAREWNLTGKTVLPGVIGLSDRIIVMKSLRVSGQVMREEATEDKLLSLGMIGEAANE